MCNLQKKLLKDSNFVIYNASAGSGKTYSLTKKYLQLLLTGNSATRFKRMLAITFTNKAVGEMKSRILDSLYAFSQPDILESQNSMFHELCTDLALSPEQMQKRCAYILKQILHNYAFFEISTIDKFNHKIIKTFAKDLQLSQNFEVELNVDVLLEKAISNLLERTGQNENLTRALLDFSLEKIDEDKSWNIVLDLLESGKLLFQENHFAYLEHLKGKSIKDLKDEQAKIGKQIRSLVQKAKTTAELALQKINEFGFEYEDFPRETLPNHFKKVVAEQFNPIKRLYDNKLEQNLEEGKLLKAKDTRDVTELSSVLLDCYTTIKKTLYETVLLKNMYSNLVPLTVLNEISKEVRRLEEEEDIIPMSSLNQMISKEIKDQPVPFLYERLGEKYRHYFIDEFQDTSKMQWENLVPLISNALESQGEQEKQGSLFLVGDIKQAIYRWRGGSSKQFLHLLESQTQPFVVAPRVERLETNWRSYSEIIEFNNTFFSYTADTLKNESYRNLFLKSCIQKPNHTIGGLVSISFLEKQSKEKSQLYCEKVLNSIKELLQKGYTYRDICVLVRKNTIGSLVAEFLSEHSIPIISSDSLLLAQNRTVQFLVSLLKMMDDPRDKNFTYEVLSFLSELKNIIQKHDFIVNHIESPSSVLSDKYGFLLESFTNKSVFEILEHAIHQFGLSEGSEAYITFLMDEVVAVERKNGPSIPAFLEHWERKKSSLSITAPDSVDAVQIMTIHKSKGLEFPAVIFPFADSPINGERKKNTVWIPSEELELGVQLEYIPINTLSEVSMFPENIKQTLLDEEHKVQMDAMNVLYVALTRAEKALYIVTEKANPNNSIETASSYSDLFELYLKQTGHFKEDQNEYILGELPPASKVVSNESIDIPYISRPFLDNDFTMSTLQGQLWDTDAGAAIELGNLVHHILSKVNYLDDVATVLNEIKTDISFQTYDYATVERLVKQTVFHPLIATYFSKPYTIYNEQEILIANGQKLRPDRIAILENEATVLDFKTGKPSNSHKVQIAKYSEALKAMGFSIKNTIIVYIGEEIQPLFL